MSTRGHKGNPITPFPSIFSIYEMQTSAACAKTASVILALSPKRGPQMAAQFVLPGKVYLVGAGPGSAKMLTLRAAELLRQADVVLHDDLVSAEVLALIPAHTAVHNVGKRCGFKRGTQEELQRRMIAAARAGQSVVRLKGGGPPIFGRTGEEIRARAEKGNQI